MSFEPEYYNIDGEPIDMMTWAKLFGMTEYKIVERTIVNKYLISTVWLGLNHNIWDGPPLIFETMVFYNTGQDDYMERYSTLEQAKQGHIRIVNMVKVTEGIKVNDQAE